MHIAFNKEFNKKFDKWKEESDPFELNEDEWNQLMKSIENPEPPNEFIKTLMKCHH